MKLNQCYIARKDGKDYLVQCVKKSGKMVLMPSDSNEPLTDAEIVETANPETYKTERKAFNEKTRNDLVYVVGPADLFNAEFYQFQQGQGWYYEAGFSNWGSIVYSLDGSKVYLEELPERFKPEHLAREDVQVFTQEEFTAYLAEHKAEWQNEEEL